MRNNRVAQEKDGIRAQLQRERRGLSKQWVDEISEIILEKLKTLKEFARSRTVHCYVAWRNEVQTQGLIKEMLNEGRRVVVPVVDFEKGVLIHSEIQDFAELTKGAYGILEPPTDLIRPVQISELDLIVVPGVAFDLEGNRIGHGGGYYDAFLSKTTALKIGLGYQFQILQRMPTETRDQRVDMIISEKGRFRVSA